ncbi:hypothetical protein, conserved [Babesia bigemina]|uniref:C3H1-type domain-containing protein n=1 Tax=Babesia bigemina TaxID=5866 RepID=A0A061BIM3_BABBI|nr:hypothetical protein, conserved [Babesia bigemina]CDR71367.1 hypothetical protein, conserved [Babesia bigemina]|eukprot:XP_012770317.1 hypothetical protein, conserved [Babesia bigemina]
MGFLSGVLEAVKDENEVETYDKNDDLKLEKVLDTLTKKIGSGRAGLAASVGAVKGWLEGYEREVEEKTKTILSCVSVIKNSVESNFNKISQPKNNNAKPNEFVALAEVTNHLKQCIDTAMKGTAAVLDVDNYGLRSLDLDLRKKLREPLMKVKHEVQRFGMSSDKDLLQLEEMKKNVNNTLEMLKTTLKQRIKYEVACLVGTLKQKVCDLKKQLKTINAKLAIYARNMYTWITDAEKIVGAVIYDAKGIEDQDIGKNIQNATTATADFVESWQSKLSKHFTEVVEKAQKVESVVSQIDAQLKKDLERMEGAIFDPLSSIKTRSQALESKFKATKSAIEKAIKKVEGDIAQLQSLAKFEDIDSSLGDKTRLLKAIGDTSSNSFDTLKDYFSNITTKLMMPLKEAMARIGEGVGRVGNKVKKDEFNSAFAPLRSHILAPLQELQNVISGAAMSFDITKVSIDGIDMTSIPKLTASIGPNISSIQKLLPKLRGHSNLITQEDLQNFVRDLGKIPQAVSEHSHKIVETVMTTVKNEVQKEIGEVVTEIDKSVKDCKTLVTHLGGKVTLKKIKIDGEAVLSVQKLLTDYHDQIDRKLEEMKDTLTKKTFKKMTSGGINGIDVSQTLTTYHSYKNETLKPAVDAAHSKASELVAPEIDAVFSNLSSRIKENLDALLKAFADTGKNIKNNMENLKKYISKGDDRIGLQQIHKNICDTIENELATAIRHANAFICTDADKCQENCLDALNEFFDCEIQKAQDNIIAQAEKQYVDSRIHGMSILNNVVEKQYEKIVFVIGYNKANGVKGMFNILKDKLIVEVGEMKDTNPSPPQSSSRAKQKSPLSEASKLLNKGIMSLVGAMEEQRKEFAEWPAEFADRSIMFPDSSTYVELFATMDTVLTGIMDSNHFDHKFTDNLQSLTAALSAFAPTKFGERSSPILQAFKDGISGLARELDKSYVSTYCCQPFVATLVEPEISTEAVCLTTLSMFFHELYYLFYHCTTKWQGYTIDGKDGKNDLKDFLLKSGYEIYNLINKDHDARNVALRLSRGFNQKGEFDKAPDSKLTFERYFTSISKFQNVVSKLFGHLETYLCVTHLRHLDGAKAPRNIYQMLQWCCGLRYNPMYEGVCEYIRELFPKVEKGKNEQYSNVHPVLLKQPATQDFNAQDVYYNLQDVCKQTETVLIAIQGHGHAAGRYAVDFSTNEDKLLYPNKPSQCFDQLFAILCRLHQQLYFLCSQVHNGTESSGWRDCWYGRYVGGSAWDCNTHQCADQKCNQTRNQIHDQNGDQHPSCGLKSPLQSFLEDGLPAFLPHSIGNIGCRITCNMSNHFGKPCKTPMGFTDITTVASHTMKGEHLKAVLRHFCGYQVSALSKLCAQLNCLLATTPKTLDDLFSFFFNFLYHWNHRGQEHKKEAFNKAINKAYFENPYDLNPTTILNSSHHHDRSGNNNHLTGDLFSLVYCNYATDASVRPCGYYLKPLSEDISCIFSYRNADKYLSWVVYLTETFYNLLHQLWKECCDNCTSPGSKCHGKVCIENCPLSNEKPQSSDNHDPGCKSIVQCPATRPTLSKYGFTLYSPHKLTGAGTFANQKRTCKDFCDALKIIVGENSVLIDLRQRIDNFIWTIREPFTYLVLALWSLSLFYLLCVMVGRLDVLHIRSHLRIPSSHKITAQSLLAAAQVGRLAKISYLQP